MKTDFSGQVVLVTGASRGIGREIARQFADRGARTVVHYHQDRKAAEQVRSDLAGGPHLVVQADLGDTAAVERLAEKSIQDMGAIDVLVNNAGVYEFHPVATTTFEDWRSSWEKTIFTNLMGPAHLSYHVIRHMLQSGGGKIINITSRGAFRGEPNAPAYGASKAGVNALNQSLAVKLAPYGIFVGVVAPGFVETELTAAKLSGTEGEAMEKRFDQDAVNEILESMGF